MEIQNSNIADMPAIFDIYKAAVEYQKAQLQPNWSTFSQTVLENEISEKRHWKILVDGRIGCVFSITYNDPDIWFEMDNDTSIYVHRIAVSAAAHGFGFVPVIVKWAKQHAIETEKTHIRIDTLNGNKKLIGYYIKCGFTYVAALPPRITETSPPHYKNAVLGLLEIVV